MSSSLGELAYQNWEQAYLAEAEQDLAEALRLYRLLLGYFVGGRRLEKDGTVIERGDLMVKIKDLETQLHKSQELHKYRRVPVTTGRPEE